MASYLSLFVILAIFFPVIASATDFVVGDDAGWTLGFDYQVWAQGKDFQVGDRLVFNYPIGAHNVFKVNGTAFQSCTIPPPSEALTSGHDIIILKTSGTKWYICGVGQHCLPGQKLSINVSVKFQWTGPSPSPSQSKAEPYSYGNSTNSLTLNIFYTYIVMIVFVLAILGF